jgi:5-methylcytosine-specific restriction endonuclease McrA
MRFSDTVKKKAWDRQKGRCGMCGTRIFSRGQDGQAHHIEASSFGGQDTVDNCVYLCYDCHKQFGHGMFPKSWTGLQKSSGFKWNPPLRKEDYRYFNG